MQATAAGFEVRTTCLLVARLAAPKDGGDTFEVGGAGFFSKRECKDQRVGGVADLAERDGRIFPPEAARSGVLRRDD